MPNSSVFECPTPKCGYAIDADGLNAIQLKALRMWAKTCPRCGKLQRWQEKLPLLNTKTTDLGGSKNASHSKTNTKTASQKRRSSGYTGH